MADLEKCDPQQIAVFRRILCCAVFRTYRRHGIADIVVVVTQKPPEVIYWEDVEGCSTFPNRARRWCA